MTDLTWAIIVCNEIRGAEIDTALKYRSPQIDIWRYTTVGIDHNTEDWTSALLDWIDSLSDKFDRAAFAQFMSSAYNPAFEKLSGMGIAKANRLCERIIRAHDLADGI